MTAIRRNGVQRTLMTTAALAFLGACADSSFPDFDLRDLGNGFDTSDAVANIAARPAPDDRGVISYPNYQVVLAQRDDTIRTIAGRLGLDAATLATFNGIGVDAPLRRDELIALPSRVAEPSAATGAVTSQPLDVAAVATTALDRVDTQPIAATPSTAPVRQTGAEPVRYQVGRGDTAFSIARQFNVPVASIAEWNGLSSNLEVREGQFLLIPQNTTPSAPQSVATASVTSPGTGTATPVPPSASAPLPDETPSVAVAAPATPDLGTAPATPVVAPAPVTPAPAAPTNSNAQLVRPVSGTIIRAYAPGRNEGIDIGVAAGTAVQAADAGSVAAVTTDTSGDVIVVIRHDGNLLTIYDNLADLSVAKGDTVSRGQTIAKVASGEPSFLHFEVRRGLESLNPEDFLP